MKALVKVSAHNEAENLPEVLNGLQRLRRNFDEFDILVVDDGSQDGTEALIKKARVPFIRFSQSRGISAGHREGLRYASEHGYDICVMLDGDGQHDPQYVPQVLKALNSGVGFVQCTRYHNEEEYARAPLDRRLLCDAVLGMLCRYVGWKPLTDALCGFWGMRREVFVPLLSSLNIEGYGFQIELILRLWYMNPRPQRSKIPHPAIYRNGTNRLDLLYTETRLMERMERFTIHAHHVYEVLRDLGVPPQAIYEEARGLADYTPPSFLFLAGKVKYGIRNYFKNMRMEYVDVVDINDRVIGRELKTHCHNNGLLHRGAALLVFKEARFQQLLLQKRSKNVSNPGLLCSPGGHVISGESYASAAERECCEELFSRASQEEGGSPIIQLEYLFTFLKDDPRDRELIAVFRGVCSGPFFPDPQEVKSLQFMDLQKIKADILFHSAAYTLAFQNIFEKYLYFIA